MEQVLLQLLSSYSGRDKLMRTSSYAAMFLAGQFPSAPGSILC